MSNSNGQNVLLNFNTNEYHFLTELTTFVSCGVLLYFDTLSDLEHQDTPFSYYTIACPRIALHDNPTSIAPHQLPLLTSPLLPSPLLSSPFLSSPFFSSSKSHLTLPPAFTSSL